MKKIFKLSLLSILLLILTGCTRDEDAKKLLKKMGGDDVYYCDGKELMHFRLSRNSFSYFEPTYEIVAFNSPLCK